MKAEVKMRTDVTISLCAMNDRAGDNVRYVLNLSVLKEFLRRQDDVKQFSLIAQRSALKS